MSTTNELSLADRRNELTRRLILDTAVGILEVGGVSELTMRAVAQLANMSERTMFRYFETREELLDAVTAVAHERMALPPPPRTLEELRTMPRRLYESFEAQRKLVIAGLHSEMAHRFREATARTRWSAVGKLVAAHGPRRSAHDRKLATVTISHYLGATTWQLLRFAFALSPDEAIECAEKAIAAALDSLA